MDGINTLVIDVTGQLSWDVISQLSVKPTIEASLLVPIGLFHNGDQIKYSFVLMLISLSSLAMMSKFENNICFKMRAVGLININAKECKGGRHL